MDTQRRTKIVATLGPATDDPSVIAGMVAGRARCGAHQFLARHARIAAPPRRDGARGRARRPAATSACWPIWPDPRSASRVFARARCSWPRAPRSRSIRRSIPRPAPQTRSAAPTRTCPPTCTPGDTLLLSDGQIVLEVEKVVGTRIACVVRSGGELSNRKGVNRQGGGISAPALTEKDLDDIRLAAELGIDYLAVSFARDADDIRRAQSELRKLARRGARGRQDRAARGARQSRRHPVGDRRGHGGARRSRRRDGLCRAHRTAEDHHPPVAGAQSRGDHGHADDGIDDPESDSDARRGQRRRQRGARRHRCGDAVGRDRGRQVSRSRPCRRWPM